MKKLPPRLTEEQVREAVALYLEQGGEITMLPPSGRGLPGFTAHSIGLQESREFFYPGHPLPDIKTF